jgi:hypothetical protein
MEKEISNNINRIEIISLNIEKEIHKNNFSEQKQLTTNLITNNKNLDKAAKKEEEKKRLKEEKDRLNKEKKEKLKNALIKKGVKQQEGNIEEESIYKQPIVEDIYEEAIYIDALNFKENFSFDLVNHWNFSAPEKKISELISVLKLNKIEPFVFIDAARITDETIEVYKKRREDELRRPFSEEYCFNAISQIMFDLFSACGAKCHFSYKADADDTLAAYCNADKRKKKYILSRDRDFYRYIDTDYYVVTAWSINYKTKIPRISFENKHRFKKERHEKDKRKLINPLPETSQSFWKSRLKQIGEKKYFLMRGTVTNHDSILGNPHFIVRKLRLAFYKEVLNLGKDNTIIESFPYFDNQKNDVFWSNDELNPIDDEEVVKLLYDPEKAIEVFFPFNKEKPYSFGNSDWNNYCFNCNSLIYELCSESMKINILDLIKKDSRYT